MSSKMNRGLLQSLYKYLPGSWIDFSVRDDNERGDYYAYVKRWNSDKLEDINKKRLLRTVNSALKSFGIGQPSGLDHTRGFGYGLNLDNCDVRCPKHETDERGIIADISPLVFFCPSCHRLYKFTSRDYYYLHKNCKHCKSVRLKQFPLVFTCKECGHATADFSIYCSTCKSSENVTWSGHLSDYNFKCTKCGKLINLIKPCDMCGSAAKMLPKPALGNSQYYAQNISLVDIIDAKCEDFLSTPDGPWLVIAYWLGKITRDELTYVIEHGIQSDPDVYERSFQKYYQMFIDSFLPEESAQIAAKSAADNECGSKYNAIVTDLRNIIFTSTENISRAAETILEFCFVNETENSSDLNDAVEASLLLNTSANPETYKPLAEEKGLKTVKVCGEVPFINCSYGYTRIVSSAAEGAVIHAFKEEKAGIKNIYASKLTTECVLFEFDRVKIIQWLLKNNYIPESDAPKNLDDENEVKAWFIQHVQSEKIQIFDEINPDFNPVTYYVYRLIHTLTHLLIRSAASICGLDKNSMSEYILPNIPGALIYCQNSQGTNLGALFNLFEAYFDKWIKRANMDANKCIFDPICIDRDRACTGCLFLNEVSCQHFNHDLDRSLVIGRVDYVNDRRHYGFWEE